MARFIGFDDGFVQDDGLVGIPTKFNRYKRGGKKVDDQDKAADGSADKPSDGPDGGEKTSASGDNNIAAVPEEGEGEVGGGAGLTLIKIRLFKEVKKDEVRPPD